MALGNPVMFHPVLKRNRQEKRVSTSIRISERVYLYAKERYNIPLTIEESFKTYLQRDGVDVQVPHDSEHFGTDGDGKPMTFGDARKLGLVDKRGRAVVEPGVARDAPEGAIV